jgi:hypothetical protein
MAAGLVAPSTATAIGIPFVWKLTLATPETLVAAIAAAVS